MKRIKYWTDLTASEREQAAALYRAEFPRRSARYTYVARAMWQGEIILYRGTTGQIRLATPFATDAFRF